MSSLLAQREVAKNYLKVRDGAREEGQQLK